MKDDEYTIMGNVTQREVYCYQCKEYSQSAMRLPKCEKCGNKLFTVVHDALTGKRITGAVDA